MLSIEHISKSFGTKKILDDVSLQVPRGGIALLLGQSGVGKSTLLRVLNNLETIDQGTITLDNNILDLHNVNATHTVGMVFQHFNLFEHLTVQENITLALIQVMHQSTSVAQATALKLLKHYGLEDKAHVYPAQLSGGQKQRLALARTLATRPQVICLDEPTSALDPLLTNYVASNIQELANEGFIVIVATHDVALIDKLNCTIYLMEHGKIIEQTDAYHFKMNKTLYQRINAFVLGITHTSN